MKEKTSQPDLAEKRRADKKIYQKGKKIALAGVATTVALDPAFGLPVSIYGAGKMAMPLVRQRAIEKMLKGNPKLAREVAEKAAKTRFADYFETLAKKAEGKAIKRRQKLKADAQRLQYIEWLKPRSKILQGVMERKAELARIKAELARADRKWAERNEKIRKQMIAARKVREAERKAKLAFSGMAAKAGKSLRKRRKPN